MSRVYENGKYRDLTPEEEAEVKKAEEEYKRSPEYKAEQINAIKEELAKYDYIGTKIAMGVATTEEYAEQIAYTEELRKQIRELEREEITNE